MEQGSSDVPLAGREIHGFVTAADLDVQKLIEDASKRWLRPNEVHVILSNYTCFRIQPQPVNVPPSGSLLLFDRKVLRNFRKDGHNWRKKKDGKTVQEAHEKLKIGNEERIHVYYARNEDDPNFYRRCYWLLDRNLDRIVLVHYRQTLEESSNQPPSMPVEPKEAFHSTSPLASLNSTTGSNHSEISNSKVVSEEINSGEDFATCAATHFSPADKSTEHGDPEFTLDELDRLGWKDLMDGPSHIDLSTQKNGNITSSDQHLKYQLTDSRNYKGNDQFQGMEYHNTVSQLGMMSQRGQGLDGQTATQGDNETTNAFADDIFQNQNSFGKYFGKWDSIIGDSAGPLDDLQLQFQASENHVSTNQFYQEQLFSIVDISPPYAYSMEETKIIVVGYFHESHKYLEFSNVFCVFGGKSVVAEQLQVGVYRTKALPLLPGIVDFYLSLDGHTPISQIIDFEYRSVAATPVNSDVTSPEVDNEVPKQRVLKFSVRLAHLLFSTTDSISILSSKISPNSMKEAKGFASLTSPSLENQWIHLLDVHKNNGNPLPTANQDFFELILRNKLQEWLLLKVAGGCKTTSRDSQGQGAIHLCAMLDYAWAIRLFSLTSLSLDFRDTCGWTPLHWAAYYGREKTVAALLSAGANPSLVADPTPDFPGGCTPADLASQEGFEGLSAYLAEKGLSAHFQAMALSGNIDASPSPGSVDPMSSENVYPDNFSEQELCLKDSLAAYRNAAEAADRIQTAFRERFLKQQVKAAWLANPESEAASIVAALKIQKAFRNYNRRKLMKAAVRIQGTFRTWQARKNFLNMRRHAIKIQAAFRGHLERRQYHKILWTVGVLEKAVLRWRLKRKGLRGLQAESTETVQTIEEENCVEEDFYRISREQAEDRIKRSVVRVQAMFRSYRAQQEYRRMKMAHNQAKLEYNEYAANHRL